MDVKCSHVLPQQRVSANLRVCGTWTREIFQVLIQNLAMMCQMWCVSFSFSCIRTNTHSWIQLFHITFTFTHTNLSHSCPDRYYHSSSTILTYCVCFRVGLLTFVFDAEGVQVRCVLCAIFCPHFYSFQHTAHNITHCGPGNKQTWYPYCIKSSHMFTLSLINVT